MVGGGGVGQGEGPLYARRRDGVGVAGRGGLVDCDVDCATGVAWRSVHAYFVDVAGYAGCAVWTGQLYVSASAPEAPSLCLVRALLHETTGVGQR